MSMFKPLVLDPNSDPVLKQLQGNDDLEIPLEDRVELLEYTLKNLMIFLQSQGIETPNI